MSSTSPAIPGQTPPDQQQWADWVKDYYRNVESYDWADIADNIRGPETFFHRTRSATVQALAERYAREEPPILDAGCGTGLNLRHLPPGSLGLDINPRNVELVNRRLAGQRAVLGDIEDMPFDDDSFGSVICTEVLEHVPDSGRALEEIGRVLRPGGALIGSVPARSLIWRFRFLSRTGGGGEPFHNEYRRQEVADMLDGFEVERVSYSMMRFNVLFVARTSSS